MVAFLVLLPLFPKLHPHRQRKRHDATLSGDLRFPPYVGCSLYTNLHSVDIGAGESSIADEVSTLDRGSYRVSGKTN